MYPLRSLIAAVLLLLSPVAALAANSVLIWPIDPKIPAEDKAAELWLENRGDATTLMQVRVFGWQQQNGQEQFQTQQNVVASPPLVRIEPGQRQLVRLIKQAPLPASAENAYRVLLDEIPTPQAHGDNQAGLNLQMRYSVPLFAYGDGLTPEAAKPQLSWRIAQVAGKSTLEVTNRGPGHARLSNVYLNDRRVAEGLFGYVLPNSTQQWPLPFAAGNSGELRADLGSKGTAWRSRSAAQ